MFWQEISERSKRKVCLASFARIENELFDIVANTALCIHRLAPSSCEAKGGDQQKGEVFFKKT
jgi:hypothetical protein